MIPGQSIVFLGVKMQLTSQKEEFDVTYGPRIIVHNREHLIHKLACGVEGIMVS